VKTKDKNSIHKARKDKKHTKVNMCNNNKKKKVEEALKRKGDN
jgi:rRNA maturation endonuclease Nob1